MVPATLSIPCLVLGTKAWMVWHWQEWALVPYGLAAVLFIAALVNVWAYVAEHWADVYANIRTANNSTPEVRMFEAAKTMHPETVKALLMHRRTAWRIKYVALKDVTDWILDEAQTVHAGFVDFVLEHSNDVSLMPKRFLAEGSTKYDPDGLITDYQQYDDLLFLMQQKLMCTQAFGNQPPHLLPPWTVGLLQKRFGLDGEGYEVDDGMSEAMRSVVRNQAPLSPSTGTSPQMPAKNGGNLGGEVPNVIESALADLEQTSAMKAAAARVYKLNS